MPDTTATPDYTAPAFATALLAVMLISVREILVPPLVLLLVLAGLWPLRQRPGVHWAMVTSCLLTLLWSLKLYGSLLGPFVFALAVAYLLTPLVDRLEGRRVSRGLAVVLVAVPPLAALVAIVLLAGPQLWSQSSQVAAHLPQFVSTLIGWLDALRDRLQALRFLTEGQRTWLRELDATRIAGFIQAHGDQILRQLGEWGLALLGQLGSVFGFLGYVVVSPVVAFYLLRDWRPLVTWLEGLVPPSRRPALVGFLAEYDGALGKFVRGQLLEAGLVGVLTCLGLVVLGVPNALLLGLVAGAFNLIPYIGIAISAVPALIVALTMADPLGGLWRVAAVFAVVQFIDGSVSGPRIVGESVGLHPVAIMLALTFGGTLLGFVGLLLAIPLAVLIKMLGARALTRYRASAYYTAAT